MPKLSRDDIENAVNTDVSYQREPVTEDDDKTSYFVIDWGRKSYHLVVEMEKGRITDIVNTKVDHEGKVFYVETWDHDDYYYDKLGIIAEDGSHTTKDFSYAFYADKLKEEFVGENLDYLKGYIMVCENRKLGIFEKEIDENAAKKALLLRSKYMTIEQKIAEGWEKRNRRYNAKMKNIDPLADKADELSHGETDQDRLERYQSLLYQKYGKELWYDDAINKISAVGLAKRLEAYKKTKSLKEVSKLQPQIEKRKPRFRQKAR